MKHTLRYSAVINLLINTFAQIPHEIDYFVGCFVNGTTEVHFEFDAEEMLYVDFSTNELIYTIPTFINPDPSQIVSGMSTFRDALINEDVCLSKTKKAAIKLENQQEKQASPEITIYPSEEVQTEVENNLICFVNNFYPPSINISWTKNGHPVSEGVSLSRYYPQKDQTFYQFSFLTFTPSEGDIYSCTVEHSALETPKTKIWEPDVAVNDQSPGPKVVCGVGMVVFFLGFGAGVFFFVKAQRCQWQLWCIVV
ncbi:H-2 class II histocompatibility antigen, A-U alpha chain-like [Betta splendens]|uniref:H-2 class II histocompatibility antigen, A-U alpha chain-like n=1 Tax=Betta splendens TaxID=158456 RepID=A0A9W2XBL8_BETSP|nr:H-2 class II histocompatibility antigen, A-U alpha chain-like [Betta splendens]